MRVPLLYTYMRPGSDNRKCYAFLYRQKTVKNDHWTDTYRLNDEHESASKLTHRPGRAEGTDALYYTINTRVVRGCSVVPSYKKK